MLKYNYRIHGSLLKRYSKYNCYIMENAWDKLNIHDIATLLHTSYFHNHLLSACTELKNNIYRDEILLKDNHHTESHNTSSIDISQKTLRRRSSTHSKNIRQRTKNSIHSKSPSSDNIDAHALSLHSKSPSSDNIDTHPLSSD